MSTSRYRTAVCLGLLALLLTTPACWDGRDIEHRAMVLAVAIDQSETGEACAVSLQIAIPGASGRVDGGEAGTTFSVTASGESLAAAIQKIQYRVPQPLFFGHTRLIAVSEGIAARGLAPFLDFFRRNAETRRTAWLVIAQPTARDILEYQPPLEEIPAFGLAAVLETQVYLQHLAGAQLSEFWSRLDCPAEEPVVPILTKAGETVNCTGTAVFRDDRMVGALDREETIYLLILLGRQGYGEVEVTLPESGEEFTLALSNVTRRVLPQVEGDRIAFTILVRAEARVIEARGPVGINSLADVQSLERELARQLQRNLLALLTKEQQVLRSDPYPFGEIIRARFPSLWNRIDWRETFPSVPMTVQVTALIRRVGETGH